MNDIFKPIPKSAIEAARLIRCYGKALEIIGEGYQFIAAGEPTELSAQNIIVVLKPNGETYHIYTGWQTRPNGCTCPDFANHPGSFCKHTLAYQETLDQQEQAEEFFARMDEMMANAECATGCDPYYCRY